MKKMNFPWDFSMYWGTFGYLLGWMELLAKLLVRFYIVIGLKCLLENNEYRISDMYKSWLIYKWVSVGIQQQPR